MTIPDVTALRLQLRAAGFSPLPTEGKAPPMNGWTDKLDASDDEIRLWPKTWHLARNTGILAKFAPGLDIDITIEAAAKAIEALAREHFEERGNILVRIGKPPKRLIPLRTDEPFAKHSRVLVAPDGSTQKLEVLCDGQQYVVDGIHPETKRPYGWHGGALHTTKRDALPYVRRNDMVTFLDAAARLLVEDFGFTEKSASGQQTNGGEPHEAGEEPRAPPERITAALAVIPNDADWDGWNAVGMAVWRATGGSAEGFAAFDAWSKKSPKYNARTTAEKWATLFKSPPTHIGAGTIFYLADDASPDWREEHEARKGAPQPQPSPQPQPGPPPQPGPQPRQGPQPQPGPPQPGPQPQPATAVSGLGEWDAGDDVNPPPPRGWLLGVSFCRTFLSSLIGPGGAGKTALRYAQALSLATGRKLTGEHIFQRCRVLIVSLEDDDKELRRRIRAVRLHYNIPLSDVKGWLFLAAPGAKAGKLMGMDKRGRAVPGKLGTNLEATIIARKIDFVMLDPFVKTHSVEENLNSAIDDVVQILTDLATKHNIAIDAPHHVRKGQMEPGDADAGRGASAYIDAARLVYTCLPMSEDDAQVFGINQEDRRDYIRVDSGKPNIARRNRNAKWFRLVSVTLDNPTAQYPAGDEVQTVEPWSPPDLWTGTTSMGLNAVLTDIDRGLTDANGNPTGQRYSDSNAAKDRAAWRVVQKHYPQKTKAQCRQIIAKWVETELLYPDDYDDPVDRKPRKGLYVDDAKRPS
jgi:hypothetical protein